MKQFTLLVLFILSSLYYTQAATIIWIGGAGDWDDPTNWDAGLVPGPLDEVIIPAIATVQINSGYYANIQNLRLLTPNVTLSIESGATLNISGASTNAGIFNRGTLLVNDLGTLLISNITVSGPSTSSGHGIYNEGIIESQPNSFIQINNCEISGIFNNNSGSFLNAGVMDILICDQHSIINKGNFSNRGSLVSNLAGISDIKNGASGVFKNRGTLELLTVGNTSISNKNLLFNHQIGTITTASGIENLQSNSGTNFNNDGYLLIQDGTIGLFNDMDSDFVNNGDLIIEHSTDNAIENASTGRFTNEGAIEIMEIDNNSGILNNGLFNNKTAGSITIQGISGVGFGILNLSVDTEFINQGDIVVNGLSTANHGIANIDHASFVNQENASITISSSAQSGIYTYFYSTFTNDGEIEISDCRFGLRIGTGAHLDNNAAIEIKDSQLYGLDLFTSLASMSNTGTINLEGNATGIKNQGTLENQSCATISTLDLVDINAGATLDNKGIIINRYSDPHENDGTILNEGVIQDQNEGFDGLVDNQSIIINSWTGVVQVGTPVTDALQLGSLDYFMPISWTTNRVFGVPAGTYDEVNNEFTPSITSVGNDAIYVTLEDNDNQCSFQFIISIPGSIQLFQENPTDIFFSQNKPNSKGFQLFPNPAAENIRLTIPIQEEGNLQLQIFNAIGEQLHTKQLSLPNESEIILDPFLQSEGIFFVQIIKENQIIWNQKLIKTQ